MMSRGESETRPQTRETRETRPLLRTSGGMVAGWATAEAEHFTAIPYSDAAPFDPPRRARWEGTIDCGAQRRGTRTTLSVTRPRRELGAEAGVAGAGAASARWPIVVYVHGGRYESGHADRAWYAGDGLARRGVVTVSVNYRHRFSGFLPLEDDPSFRGIEDLFSALEWVRENAAELTGAEASVTLMGQSAGGGMILWAMCDPRLAGLIDRAVVLSPGFPGVGYPERAAAAQADLGRPLRRAELNAHPDVDGAYRRFARRYPTDCALGPYPFDPQRLDPSIPLVLSTLRDEFVGHPFARISDRLARVRPQAPAVRALMRATGAPEDPRWWEDLGPQPVGRMVSDVIIRRWAAAAMEARPDCWAVEWTYDPATTPEPLLHHGAQHCAELPLLFDALDDSAVPVCGPDAPVRLQGLATQAADALAAFARGATPTWPRYGADRATLQVDMASAARRVVHDPLRVVREAWPASALYG